MELAARFHTLFAGNERAHGTFSVHSDRAADGKKTGQARVLREPPTQDLWDKHLKGESGLGIIPIKDNNCCHWGAVDVDVYNLDHASLIRQVEKHGLPGVVCRSKSGGAHLFFFFAAEVPAEYLQPKLVSVAAMLGYGGSEVFPKQQKILVERGDTGNFLNMPYFSGPRTTRYGYNSEGESLGPAEFLDFATSRRIDPDLFLDIPTSPKKADELLPKGPPCLQHLAAQGFGEGSRNNALFNLGVYARMAKPDEWEAEVHRYNAVYMNPPLTEKEVSLVISQLLKKDYFYKCEDQPIASFCNKDVCLTRKFGIGPGQRANDLGSLTKINGDPPIWILDVDGKRVELSTDALVNQKVFQKDCLNQINVMPRTMSARAWEARVQVMLSNMTLVEVPADSTSQGEFMDHLVTFCCDRARGLDREDILQGIPVWTEGKVYFQLKDLKKLLTQNQFTTYSSTKIGLRLRDLGVTKEFWNIRGRGVNVWGLPQDVFDAHKEVTIDLPPLPSDDLGVM